MYTMSKLKVGIAGYGIVGRRRHLYINEHPYLEVTAVCEQN
ncbi:gfo/Idh/MocA family oxidoreductase, partial [bacterium]|nr:gfo/Idh/MocA family oxidoreductase [bacterium]